MNDTLNETISAQITPERNGQEIRKVLTETNKLKEKCEELLPKISPGLRKDVYRKIDWSTFKLQEPILNSTGRRRSVNIDSNLYTNKINQKHRSGTGYQIAT